MAVAVATGAVVDGKAIQRSMAKDREARIATERVKIEAEDKAKFAKSEADAAEERERVKAASKERAEADAKAASKKAVVTPRAPGMPKGSAKAKAKSKGKTKSGARLNSEGAPYEFGRRVEDSEFIPLTAAVLREQPDISRATAC